MKRFFIMLALVAYVGFMSSCASSTENATETTEEHAHDGENHDGHDHEGHDHDEEKHEEHDGHDHEGHDHDQEEFTVEDTTKTE